MSDADIHAGTGGGTGASTGGSQAPTLRGATRSRVDGLILLAALLCLWQVCAMLLGARVLPGPWPTLVKLVAVIRDDDFPKDLRATCTAFAFGFAIAAVGGVAMGLVLGARRLAGDVMEPLLMALYAIPKIALYPVVLLIFGLGLDAKVAFGVIHGIVPITVFTMGAVRGMRPVYGRCARACRLTPLAYARYVLLPAAAPEVVAGLRIGFSLTLLGTLIGEMFASQSGIGHLLISAMTRNDALMIAALACLLFAFATAANLLLLRWHRKLGGVN
jgi:NitT/TauT family transport system permease protein